MRLSKTRLNVLFLIFALCIAVFFAYSAESARSVQNFYIPEEATVRRNHRTHLYRSQSWYILRRGNALAFRVQLDAELSPGQTMSLQVAPYSIVQRNSIKINHLGAGNYDITLNVPPDSPVGVFSVGIRLSDQQTVRQLPKQVAVLFNPWGPECDEYFPRPAELSEYVEQEHGITYRGSAAQVQDVRWYLGQFSQEALSVTLYFMNRLNETERKDPALVSRHLTRVSAYQTTVSDGLMEGKWEGGFGGGQNPSSWASSDQIFRMYIQQGFRTVRYAQCWVFGAVLLSMLRSAGLASNQVSVMDSTHEYSPESDRNGLYWGRIGRYFDENYRYMVAETGKIWNFHSFNLAYMMNRHASIQFSLPDWQVVDSTPQEFSREGDYRLGPAPLKAIREMRKMNHFDTAFVISEVSARHHSFLVNCGRYSFGGGQRLPPGCKITRDLGASAAVSSGTYIVAKAVLGFTQQPWTHMFHTRARSPAEDPSILARFAAVRAFDTLRNDDPTGMTALVFADTPDASALSTFGADAGTNVRTLSTFSATNTRRIPTSALVDSFDNPHINPANVALITDQANDLFDLEEDSNLLYNWHDEDELDLERLSADSTVTGKDYQEISLHQYDDTGIAMSVIIPPVEFGKPLEVYLNFACEDQTAAFTDQLQRKDLTTKVITLQVQPGSNTVSTDDEFDSAPSSIPTPPKPRDVTSCPAVAAVSFNLDLRLTDYTTRDLGEIASVNGNIILHANNGFFESYRIVINDYVQKALNNSQLKGEVIPEYIRAIVVATDHTTDLNKDIVMIAERKAHIAHPHLELIPSTTNIIIPRTNIQNDNSADSLRVDDTIITASSASTVNGIPTSIPAIPREVPMSLAVKYTNKLPFELTNVKLHISADNLGTEDNVVVVGTLKPSQSIRHFFSWNALGATDGLHFLNVILSSDQLDCTKETIEITVNAKPSS